MKRVTKNSYKCKETIKEIVQVYNSQLSVRQVVSLLNSKLEDSGHKPIQIQRVLTLLDSDMDKAISHESFKGLEFALKKIENKKENNEDLKNKIVYQLRLQSSVDTIDTNIVSKISEEIKVPYQVVAYYSEKIVSPTEKQKGNTQEKFKSDWSWQDVAVRNTLSDLNIKRGNYGLIIPTGGGKTRISQRIILEWLKSNQNGKVLWVTHRKLLLKQAKKNFKSLIGEMNIKGVNHDKLMDRFIILSNLDPKLNDIMSDDKLSLIVIDEAHHGAALSYQKLLKQKKCSVICLTATPNRTDGEDIGIEKISFQISYKELFKRNCIIEPIFEDPYYITEENSKKNYNDEDLCDELADYVLNRTQNNLNKCLICVSKRTYAENIYKSIKGKYATFYGHRLDDTQIQYIHGNSNSMGNNNEDFLKIFESEKKGILISTSSLIGEGFNDPNIDSVFITYKSESISQLMQVGGRALRFIDGKTKASIIQVHQTPLEYHFNNRWLYQDITDLLRPRLDDIEYSNFDERLKKVQELLEINNVSNENKLKIFDKIKKIPMENFRILLIGLEHYGLEENFQNEFEYKPILIDNKEFERFKEIFNEASFAYKDTRIYDPLIFLKQKKVNTNEDIFKDYTDIISTLDNAKSEIYEEVNYIDKRGYKKTSSEGTTWLKYINFYYNHKEDNLQKFLDDCLNREEIYSSLSHTKYHSVIKISYPVHSSKAYLLNEKQFHFLQEIKSEILDAVKSDPHDQFNIVQKITYDKEIPYLPMRVIDNITQLTNEKSFVEKYLCLTNN